MKHTMNSLLAFGESTLAFLAAWCMMAHISLPKVHIPTHRSSILPAVGNMARSVARASKRSNEMSQLVNAMPLERQLAIIGAQREHVINSINSIYSSVR